MRKLFILAILAAVSAIILSNCATTRVSVMGYECYSENPFQPCVPPSASEDYTQTIAPNIGRNIGNQGSATGVLPSSVTDYVAPKDNYKLCAATNSSSHDIVIVFTPAILPGRIDARQMMALSGTFIPGYEPIIVRLTRKGREGYTLKEFPVQPGEWDAEISWVTPRGLVVKDHDTLHVDQFPARNMIGGKEYHAAFNY